MKTIAQLNKHISELESRWRSLNFSNDKDMRKAGKITKEIVLARTCIKYLETNPREAFIYQQKADSEKKLEIFNRRLNEWKASLPEGALEKMKNPKTYYYKSVNPDEAKEIKNTNSQLRTLTLILS